MSHIHIQHLLKIFHAEEMDWVNSPKKIKMKSNTAHSRLLNLINNTDG